MKERVNGSGLRPGLTYVVGGYHTGDFIGELVAVRFHYATFEVVDPLRPMPRVANRCPYPYCVLKDLHAGDHELAPIRQGGRVEVYWPNAYFSKVAA